MEGEELPNIIKPIPVTVERKSLKLNKIYDHCGNIVHVTAGDLHQLRRANRLIWV